MKISKISIKNYRSCKATVFSPDENLTALIGPNGSGKTNILSAIKLLSKLLYGVRRPRYKVTEDTLSAACEIKIWFDVDGKSVIYTSKIKIVTNERNEDEIIDSQESWYMYEITGSRKKIVIPLEMLFDYGASSRMNTIGSRRRAHYLEYYLLENDFEDDVLSITSFFNC